MISRTDLIELFLSPTLQSNYLNLMEEGTANTSNAISARNVATKKSLKANNLDQSIELQGSASFETMNNLVKLLKTNNLIPEIKGYGAELGSGSALFSIAMLSQDNLAQIEGILAIEATVAFVESGISQTTERFLPQQKEKILSCLGNFERIALKANSLDFIVQFEAFHHADDLLAVHKEVERILNKDGLLISIDRSWPNYVSREVLDNLLDHPYPLSWLEKKGFPSDASFTRRMNGEHEIKDEEWEQSIQKAGLEIIQKIHFQPKLSLLQVFKSVISYFKLEAIFGVKIPRRRGTLEAQLRSRLKLNPRLNAEVLVWNHPRELTVMVAVKKHN